MTFKDFAWGALSALGTVTAFLVTITAFVVVALAMYALAGVVYAAIGGGLWALAYYLDVVNYPVNLAACFVAGCTFAVVRGLFKSTK